MAISVAHTLTYLPTIFSVLVVGFSQSPLGFTEVCGFTQFFAS